MSQVFQEHIVIVMTKVKNKQMKSTKIYLFLLPPLPCQDVEGGGGGVATPSPSNCFHGKTFENFFIDTWVSGG